MQIFINELSLEGQYYSDAEFSEAIKAFTAIFSLINEKVREKEMFKNDQVFLARNAIRNEAFQSSFQRISNKDLKNAFRDIIFNKLNPRDWVNERVHSSDDWFQCSQTNNTLITDTSVAELAERRMRDASLVGLLINFSRSAYSKFLVIDVVKNERESVQLDCISERSRFEEWLGHQLLPSFYDFSSTEPPRDKQTVLVEKTRFIRVSRVVQGRHVYQEKETHHYWYVDNLHYGSEAHLEVFDRQGVHIGESDLSGHVNKDKRDPNKRIDP